MSLLDWTYVAIAIEPFGGILVAIPLAVFALAYPLWLIVVTAPLLAYVQVLVVDLAWSGLLRWGWFGRLLERKRSPRVERLLASRGGFWLTFGLTPLVGPWVVMAFMRYAHVPQRRVAAPILLSLLAVTLATTAICLLVPEWFPEARPGGG
jgi:hypothetical protein